MEPNTEAIVRLCWARTLGLPDDALAPTQPGAPALRVEAADTAMVLRLWDRDVVVGPGWLHERTVDRDPAELADQSALLRTCQGNGARLVGQATLAYADAYVALEELDDVPVTTDAAAAVALEKACPLDDVTEVGLAELSMVVVTLDDRGEPTAGAGYDEWQGILGHLGVLTPPEQRRAGHGTRAAALALNDALDAGLVPQWRSRVDNAVSRRLARRLGFVEVGSQTTVALG